MAQTLAQTTGRIRKQTVRVKGNDYTRWIVDFGWADGKRHRRSFSTEAKAEAELLRTNKGQRRIGEKARKLSTDHLLDASAAIDILTGNTTLAKAARFYMDRVHPGGGRKTIAEVADDFYKAKTESGRRPVTIKGYRDKVGMFARDMGGPHLNEVTSAMIEQWLRQRDLKPQTRTSYLRTLGAFFQFAVKRKFLVENPVRLLDMPRLDRKAVSYLTVDEAQSLLTTAAKHDQELIPYLAIGMFAGLRPVELHGELSGHGPMDWRHVDMAKGRITVTPEQDKIREGRLVHIAPNLSEWLLPHRLDAGPIIYTRARFDAVIRESGVNYRRDVLRHTFGTYHWVKHRNEGETAIQMGDTIRTVKRHYVNPLVDPAEADRFWSIRPAGTR